MDGQNYELKGVIFIFYVQDTRLLLFEAPNFEGIVDKELRSYNSFSVSFLLYPGSWIQVF